MPNIINYKYRLWCKSCNDFTIHEIIYKDEFQHQKFSLATFSDEKDFVSICECKNQYSSVKIATIPKLKIDEQRNRYKKYKMTEFSLATSFIMRGGLNTINSMFSENFRAKTEIVESDAGLEYERKLEKKAYQIRKEETKQELVKYKNVGRNNKCLCGSNLKYKKCCLLKHSSLSVGCAVISHFNTPNKF